MKNTVYLSSVNRLRKKYPQNQKNEDFVNP